MKGVDDTEVATQRTVHAGDHAAIALFMREHTTHSHSTNTSVKTDPANIIRKRKELSLNETVY